MTKFSALSFGDILSDERTAGRAARVTAYVAEGKPFTHVAVCEADDGSWFELDATDLDHAKALAANQVDWMNCRGCSVRAVARDGSLDINGAPLYLVYAS
jgi:hypothetical protein